MLCVSPTNNAITAMNPKLPVKIKSQEADQPNHNAPIPKPEWCRWGPNCPICKTAGEDWDGDHQKQLQQTNKNTQTQDTQQKYSSQTQNLRETQAQNPQFTQDSWVPQNQSTQTPSFDVPDQYAEQIHLRREWEEKMEWLNKKYRLDYFSDSELDSESDEGENYQYEHKYKTPIYQLYALSMTSFVKFYDQFNHISWHNCISPWRNYSVLWILCIYNAFCLRVL